MFGGIGDVLFYILGAPGYAWKAHPNMRGFAPEYAWIIVVALPIMRDPAPGYAGRPGNAKAGAAAVWHPRPRICVAGKASNAVIARLAGTMTGDGCAPPNMRGVG